MKLFLISGFLGSGKTTFLLSLARQWVELGATVVIVENEVGEISIDGELIRQAGLDVWEMFNGCVCCQLGADLISTLESIVAEYAPDYIVVEPSGIAEPKRILDLLPYYKGSKFQQVMTVTLVDAARFLELVAVLAPLITAQIQAADLVVVNKIDLVTKSKLDQIRESLRASNPNAPLLALSAQNGVDPHILERERAL